jgi:4-hydroxy-tetrahydrodipicolinate synthase
MCENIAAMPGPLPIAVAPVPTPFTVEDRVDPDALRRHLQWLSSEGLDGALILGTNGEFPSLTLAERLQVAEGAATAGSGLRLLLGVGSCALGDVIELIDAAEEHGFAAVLCPPPFYFRAAPVEGLAEFFRRVLDRSPLPVLLYHIPQVTGVPISDSLLDGIGAHSRLAGVKDSSGKPEDLVRLSERFRDGAYYVGSDRLVTRCLEAGGAGSITAAASVVPDLVASISRHPERQPDLDDVRRLLEEYGLGPAVKAILRRKGFGAFAARPPLIGLDSERERALMQRFRALAE